MLAQVAVVQARSYFLARDGHWVDNPRIGPELARVWWQPGNSVPFAEFVQRLTGQTLSAAALGARLNQTSEQRKAEAVASIAKLVPIPTGTQNIDLDASIRIVHGAEWWLNITGFCGFLAEIRRLDRSSSEPHVSPNQLLTKGQPSGATRTADRAQAERLDPIVHSPG